MKFMLDILPVNLLDAYKASFDPTLPDAFQRLSDSELCRPDFSFYVSVSAVYSSKIEGEDIALDSFIKHRRFGTRYLPDYTKKIDDLYATYEYARHATPTAETIEHIHTILAHHILDPSQRGKIRNKNMYVVAPDGKIAYVAASPAIVNQKMKKFCNDMATLVDTELVFEEIFFFASMLYLVFIKILPFHDGNGRTARLLEKWFLAMKLGFKAWYVQSEKYYYDHHQAYYQYIRKLGLEYDRLVYAEALPFLQMLSHSVRR